MAARIDKLAQPKANLLKFPDRRSVYWLDELPTRPKSSTTAFELTPRWEKLTQRKQSSHFYEESRRSAEWTVSAAALRARPSARVCSLARPRAPAEGWQPERPLLATLSGAVKTADPSPRICELARPKRPKEEISQVDLSSSSPWISLPISPSSRVLRLASPKQVHPQHLLSRSVSWPVPERVLKAVASERLHTLARPRTRQALFEGFDPYRVSPAARAATASPRLRELSLPLPRKCTGH